MSTSAKVLLVGEYTVIQGGEALALPFNHFEGRLTTDDHQEGAPNLEEFWRSILDSETALSLDKQRLSFDVDKGLKFISTIPVGSGLGSSGALVAELYKQYGSSLEGPLSALQEEMASIENFFHGKSSGIDPIVCYANQPVLLNHEGQRIQILDEALTIPNTFLVHSKTTRKTSTLMEHFNEVIKSSNFEQLNQYIKQCIKGLSAEDLSEYEQGFAGISAFQMEHFEPMITSSVHSLWAEGLESRTWFMKLCGAGGGGYYLMYCNDGDRVLELSEEFEMIALK